MTIWMNHRPQSHSIINNYIIRTSILENIQLTKNDLQYIVKKDELKFDQEDITSNNINLFFKESMNYNYIREKNNAKSCTF